MRATIIFLVPVLIASLGCGRQGGQKGAVADIERLGGFVKFEEGNPQKPVIAVGLGELPEVTDADLRVLESFAELKDVCLDDTKIGDKGLAHLKGLRNLKKLHLD